MIWPVWQNIYRFSFPKSDGLMPAFLNVWAVYLFFLPKNAGIYSIFLSIEVRYWSLF